MKWENLDNVLKGQNILKYSKLDNAMTLIRLMLSKVLGASRWHT